MQFKYLTAIIHKEDDAYVSFCQELDIASQGSDIEEAKGNLNEAVEFFLNVHPKLKLLNATRLKL